MSASIDWHSISDQDIRIAITKLYIGDPLTDHELTFMISMYQDLERGLKLLGNQFHIAWWPIFDKLRMMEGFAESRAENRKRGIQAPQS